MRADGAGWNKGEDASEPSSINMGYLERQNSFALTGLTLFIAVAGVAYAWLGYNGYLHDLRYQQFVPTTAVVASSKTERQFTVSTRGGSRPHWTTRATFEFSDKNHSLKHVSTTLPSGIYYQSWGPEDSWDHGYWAAGKQFTLYVNPYNSDDWSLTQGPTPETYGYLTFGSILSIFGGIGFYMSLAKLFFVEATDPGPEYLPADDPLSLQITEQRHRSRRYY